MEIILIKLLLAHFLGDFFFQPDKWVAEKERLKAASGKLYLHTAIHVLLVFLLLADVNGWQIAFVIGLFHILIDAAKLYLQTPHSKRAWFFADQILHLVSIVFVAWMSAGGAEMLFFPAITTRFWWVILLGLFLTMPTAIIIRVLIARWIPEPHANFPESKRSLQDAGRFIGILERLLIFVFVITNHFEAVGFLLAAKSIFRFGDLKETRDIKLTEYVLIGTLLSFGIATITGLLAASMV